MTTTASGYTRADLDSLRKGLLSGVKSISMGGRRKEFQDVASMQKLYDSIAAELIAAERRRGPRRRRSLMVVDL